MGTRHQRIPFIQHALIFFWRVDQHVHIHSQMHGRVGQALICCSDARQESFLGTPDDQQVEIAMRTGISPRTRAEQ